MKCKNSVPYIKFDIHTVFLEDKEGNNDDNNSEGRGIEMTDTGEFAREICTFLSEASLSMQRYVCRRDRCAERDVYLEIDGAKPRGNVDWRPVSRGIAGNKTISRSGSRGRLAFIGAERTAAKNRWIAASVPSRCRSIDSIQERPVVVGLDLPAGRAAFSRHEAPQIHRTGHCASSCLASCSNSGAERLLDRPTVR